MEKKTTHIKKIKPQKPTEIKGPGNGTGEGCIPIR